MTVRARGAGALALACAVWAGAASAQEVQMTLTLAYNAFVVGEPVLVQVEAVNATRDLLDAGGPDSKDTLLVEVDRGGLDTLEPFRQGTIGGAFQLKPGAAYRQKLELDKWFPLVSEGKYFARVVLVHDGVRYASGKRSFDVVPGLPVKDGMQMFVKRPNHKRLFKLVYWHRNQIDRLFLRSEDEPGGKVWDTLDLGDLVKAYEPKLDISPDGEVTVLHRSTQDAYTRTVLWSLPESLEVVERNTLIDPDISASRRVKSLYGEMAEPRDADKEKKPWWKFW